MTRGHDIGKALSLLVYFRRGWDIDDDYAEAMGAPMDELGTLIARGRAKSLRLIRRQIKAITGLKWRVFKKEVKRRTSRRWCYFHSPVSYFEQFECVGRHHR